MHGSARRLILALLAAHLAGTGCSRKFFRNQADKDVAGVITQKNRFPAWEVKNWHVYPDPRARFADPFNPDRPPFPPDDYAARVLSPHPQHPHKKSGVGRVDGDGYLHLLEQWDAENRVQDPVRGAPPEQVMLPRIPQAPSAPSAPSAPTAPSAPEVSPWVSVRPNEPDGFVGPRVTEIHDSAVAPAGATATPIPPPPPGTLPDLPVGT